VQGIGGRQVRAEHSGREAFRQAGRYEGQGNQTNVMASKACREAEQ
jgi:hypothetical protein